MERRFEVRLEELLDDAVLDPRVTAGMLKRLERFVNPFADSLMSPEQGRHAWEYVAGLFSDMKRKNAETIAYLHDQDRQAMQKFIGQAPWDHRPLIGELVRQVGAELGEPDGVLVFDPSGFPKQGKASHGNGVDAWEKSTTAKWACIWLTPRGRSTPWWTCVCI